MADLKSIVTADITQLERAYRRAETDAARTAQKMDSAFKGKNPKMDFSGIKRELASLEKQAQSSAGGIRSAFSAGGGILAGAVSVAAGNVLTGVIGKIGGVMTDAVRDGIEYNKMLERSAVAFEVLTGSSQKAQTHLADLEKMALKTPFEFPDLISASLKMQAFGQNTADVSRDLPKLADGAAIAAAGSGNFKESLDGIITALGQMRAKGRLSFEEINQLTERGIPAWDILAKKVGRTKEEIMRLAERGKLSGTVGADLITQGIGEFAGGIGDRLSKTVSGKESNLLDAYKKRAGEDTQDLFRAYSDALDQGVKGFNDKVGQTFTKEAGKRAALMTEFGTQLMSGQILGSESDVKIFIDASLKTMKDLFGEAIKPFGSLGSDLWKSIQDGFVGAIGSTGKGAFDAISGWASGIKQTAKDALGIKSPSTVFREIAENVVEGFDDGIEQKIDRSSEGFKRWAKQIEKIGGEAFLQAVEEMSKRLQVDPNKVMNVMAFESKLNPKAKNPKGTATGLIQFLDSTAEDLKTTTEKLRGMNAIEQLDYVEKYFERFRNLMDTQESVYTAVLAGRPINNPDKVLFTEAKGKAGRNYRANKGLDADQSGTITVREATSRALEQGFLNPTKDVVAKFDQAVDKFREVAGMQVKGQINPEAIRMALAMGRTEKPPALVSGQVKSEALFNMLSRRPTGKVELATVTEEMKKLEPPVKKVAEAAAMASPALDKTTMAIDRVTAAGEDAWNRLRGAKTFDQLQKDADLDAKDNLEPEAAFARFQDLKSRIGQGFDETIKALETGSTSLGDAARSLLLGTINDIFDAITSEILLKATGGKASSIGGVIGNAIGGLFKNRFDPSASGNSGTGNLNVFKTPDFNPNAGTPIAASNSPLNQGIKEVAERVTDSSKTVADAVNTNGNKSVAELIKQTQLNAKMAACGCPDKVGPTKGPSLLGSILGAAIGALGAGFGGGFGGGGGSGELTGVGFEEFAKGGSYGGGLALVGEQGPELINFNRGGWVYNARQTQQMLESQQTVVHAPVTFYITAPGGQISRETQSQIAARTAEAMNHAVKRNG